MSARSLKTILVDCGSRSAGILGKIFSRWTEVERVACADLGERCPAGDLIVISGGPCFYREDGSLCREYIDQFAFLDAKTRPTLGICMGHQGIGLRHGARLFTGRERRTEETIHLTDTGKTHPLLRGIPPETRFAERHTEGITLPDNFDLLGYSRYYPVEIMAARDRPVFGVQFHPENSGKPGLHLLRNFFDLAEACRKAGTR